MNTVLISTYDLGHQSFGLASPVAWLAACGIDVVCMDLAVQPFEEGVVKQADVIAFYLPMHTATRIAVDVIKKVKSINPKATLCAYGLYAPMNEAYLRALGIDEILGGEFEESLTDLHQHAGLPRRRLSKQSHLPIPKLKFRVPNRSKLPPLDKYAFLSLPDGNRLLAGYTEASRGCKHLCRHCPIVPVYNGQFRIVQQDVVLADIAQQVEMGARHITFGDPDFFNGPRHSLSIVGEFHKRHPALTYDVTIKVEHLLKNASLLPVLRDTGCSFVTSAVESVDDKILNILDKGHTRQDFFTVVELFKRHRMNLSPTFVAFTPWITCEGYQDLLKCIASLELIDNVAPVQLGIRLLIPEGSKLLERTELRESIQPFDKTALCYRWQHPDPDVDCLQREVEARIKIGLRASQSRREIFASVWQLAAEDLAAERCGELWAATCCDGRILPHLSEDWYCCAEPTEEQMNPV